jgi:Domain of unknown function (DUF4292)
MSRSLKLFVSGLLIFVLTLQFGCKTARNIIKEPIKEQGPGYLFEKLIENELRFEFLSAKFNLEMLIDKKKTILKGQFRIAKDSLIWISFTPALGIEVARLIISQDSVKFINRIDHTFFNGDYQFLNDFLKSSIDFDILQSFIIGNDFQYYENGKFRASIDAMQYKLSTAGRHKLKTYVRGHELPQVFIQNIWLNPENFKISKVDIKELDQDNRKLKAYYSDFLPVNSQLFPHRLFYEILSETRVKVDVSISKLTLDNPLRFPFKVPKNYTRIR